MQTRTFGQTPWRILLGGLFLAVLALQGCSNQVYVTCGPNAQGSGKPGVGGCRTQPVTTDNTPIPTTRVVCKTAGGTTMGTCPSNAVCLNNTTICDPNSLSYDSNRKVCKTVWKESSSGSNTGTCECTGYY